MEVVKDLQYGREEIDELDFILVCEERNFFCVSCMRVIKGNLYVLVLNDETNAILRLQAVPTEEKPYVCEECKKKEIK